MKEDVFSFLIDVLKLLHKEDLDNQSIENAIVKLLDQQENSMTEDQKALIIKKFLNYEMKRRGKGRFSEKQSSFSSSIDIDDSNF